MPSPKRDVEQMDFSIWSCHCCVLEAFNDLSKASDLEDRGAAVQCLMFNVFSVLEAMVRFSWSTSLHITCLLYGR